MKEKLFLIFLITVLVVAAGIVFITVYQEGEAQNYREKAVKAGVGRYWLSPETGQIMFTWGCSHTNSIKP